MKMKISLFTIAASLIFSSASAQITVNRVTLPAKFPNQNTDLALNGAGVRQAFALKVYVLGLYLQTKNKNPKEIINADKPTAVRLQIISNLMTSALMSKYIREGFVKSTGGKIEPIKEQIDLICEIFNSEATKVGDVYDVFYTPGFGVSASKNNKPYSFSKITADAKKKVTNSPQLDKILKNIKHHKDGQEAFADLDFKKALFGIWLSDNPVDDDLKDAILGL